MVYRRKSTPSVVVQSAPPVRRKNTGKKRSNQPKNTITAVPIAYSRSTDYFPLDRVGVMDCVARYAAILANPFAEVSGEICAPNMYATKSTKFTTRAVMTLGTLTNTTTGATQSIVNFNPWQMLATGAPGTYGRVQDSLASSVWTNAPLVGTRSISGAGQNIYQGFYSVSTGIKGTVAPGNAYAADMSVFSMSNSPYSIIQALGIPAAGGGINVNSPWEHRVVAAGLRIRYTGQLSTTSGTMVYYREPNNDGLGGPFSSILDGLALSANGASTSEDGGICSVSPDGIQLAWKPARDNDYSYQPVSQDIKPPAFDQYIPNFDNASHFDDARSMGVIISGHPTGSSFLIEAIVHHEMRATTITSTSTDVSLNGAAKVVSALKSKPDITATASTKSMVKGLVDQGGLAATIANEITKDMAREGFNVAAKVARRVYRRREPVGDY